MIKFTKNWEKELWLANLIYPRFTLEDWEEELRLANLIWWAKFGRRRS